MSSMTNPRDFLPAKYKKNQMDSVDSKNDEKTDSPWSDLAKEPKVPEYRSNLSLDDHGIKNELDASSKLEELKDLTQREQLSNSLNLNAKVKNKKPGHKQLAGLLVVFFLVIGVFSSYMLSRQNQDVRQQASSGTSCKPDDPYCVCAYFDSSGVSCRIDYNKECVSGYHLVGGHCIPTSCQDRDGDGKYVCGYGGNTDPCTEDSMGGDWCRDQSGLSIPCSDIGMIRCKCSAGSNTGYWVIGIADSCNDLCGEAAIDCPDCPTTPAPTNPPVNPPPSTPTPTPPPQPLACGEFNCTQNSDCQNGLTCQSITVDGEAKKICSKGENQLFCASNPTTANCCESQPMPVCASIEMLDANNNLMEKDDDDKLTVGDKVRFRCSAVGNQDIDFNYEFRIWDKSTTNWVNITDESDTVAKNVSALYTINSFSKYVVQGRICWGNDCQTWEIVSGSPTAGITYEEQQEMDTALRCYGENATPCASGYVCSAIPAGGCPEGTTCASAPFCRQAEGINCVTNNDCFEGYTCYQPPMPTCPAGMSCAQVMPSKYCTKQ